VSERGGYPVEKKSMRQWFMRITVYADRLLSGLEGLEWSSHIKEIQKNWIGKSEGSEIEFSIKNHNEKIKIFTTRADTIFGAFAVI
ncbi:leucine--tRNA ligase, partial [Sutterella massiliensis]|nr:leucine--tRNA ligase [Sutterella massiliensis]